MASTSGFAVCSKWRFSRTRCLDCKEALCFKGLKISTLELVWVHSTLEDGGWPSESLVGCVVFQECHSSKTGDSGKLPPKIYSEQR